MLARERLASCVTDRSLFLTSCHDFRILDLDVDVWTFCLDEDIWILDFGYKEDFSDYSAWWLWMWIWILNFRICGPAERLVLLLMLMSNSHQVFAVERHVVVSETVAVFSLLTVAAGQDHLPSPTLFTHLPSSVQSEKVTPSVSHTDDILTLWEVTGPDPGCMVLTVSVSDSSLMLEQVWS